MSAGVAVFRIRVRLCMSVFGSASVVNTPRDEPGGTNSPVVQALDGTWHERAVPILSRWLSQISRTLENDVAAGLMLVLLVVAMLLLSFG
jgi:hypothetical protein